MGRITEQQKKFVDLYIKSGNATQSYIDAGYKAKGHAAESNASRLLRNAEVMEYIQQRNKQLETPRIASMTEVKEFWSSMLRNELIEPKDRLKASEYIAKTNAAFIDRTEHSGSMQIAIEGEVKEWAK